MKQGETKSAALLDSAAILQELSNTESSPIPRLIILIPFRSEYNGVPSTPPMSVTLEGVEVDRLFELLKEYYSYEPVLQTAPR